MGLREGIPLGDHKADFVMELEPTAYFGENAKSSSRKTKNKERSLGENHTVAPPNHKIVKTKDVSNGENPTMAPEDGGFDLPLPSKYLEKLALLVEDSTEINLGTEQNPKTTFLAASLSKIEHRNLNTFFLQRTIKFAWTYADMLRLDPKLVVHYLIVDPTVKPVKQKLRKMHPQIALLVKVEI